MGWSLKSPKISSYGHPFVLTASYRSITSSVIFTGVRCERCRRFLVRRISKQYPTWRLYQSPSMIDTTVRCLPIVLWGSSLWFTCKCLLGWRRQNFLYSATVISTSCPGPFVMDIPAPGFDRGKSFSQKISVTIR